MKKSRAWNITGPKKEGSRVSAADTAFYESRFHRTSKNNISKDQQRFLFPITLSSSGPFKQKFQDQQRFLFLRNHGFTGPAETETPCSAADTVSINHSSAGPKTGTSGIKSADSFPWLPPSSQSFPSYGPQIQTSLQTVRGPYRRRAPAGL